LRRPDFSSYGGIIGNSTDVLNLGRSLADSCAGAEFQSSKHLEMDMPKATRLAASINASAASRPKSKSHPLVSIMLFSALGLFVSLVAVLMGMQFAGY
jgi:hypothetical protein